MIQSVWKNLTGLQKAAEHLWCDFTSLFLCFSVARNYTSFSLDPTLKWSEMTEHLRRDDPSEDLRGSQPSAIILN